MKKLRIAAIALNFLGTGMLIQRLMDLAARPLAGVMIALALLLAGGIVLVSAFRSPRAINVEPRQGILR